MISISFCILFKIEDVKFTTVYIFSWISKAPVEVLNA